MLQIRLLGQFDIRLDGKRVLIPSRAGQSLLAYLTLTAGTPHRREKLSGTFWPDTSDETARKNLRHELWRIRKAVSGEKSSASNYLLAEEITITFNRDAEYWLDVAQLEKPDIDLESLTSALSLYQGELLPGFYEDWIVLERERIQTIFDSKMEQLLGQLVSAERWMSVQEQAERWLSLGNTLEPAYRALMLAHGARGDMAKVSSMYQRCMEELDEQFGLEPSAETRALYDGLLKGAQIPARSTAQTSGTITFLFTDIEESTHLLDKLGDRYAIVLEDHHKILRAAIQKWNGREVDTQGDAFFITFSRALDAVQCAAEAQRALASHIWAHKQPLRVRMGLHTGEPLITSTGYVGMDVHRAARIGDAGHGGQVLLSQTTRELVIRDLPQGVTIRDLGEHRLKDMKFPTFIYQLGIEGLADDFPPLRTRFTGTEAPTPGEPPFKGLQYFEEADSDLFFGRELLTAKLVNRLRGLPSPLEGEGPGVRFLSVIIGASGSGKSSLVRAGLIPALKKGEALMDGTKPPEGSADWQVHVITPTAHPLEALATELTRDSESVTATATLMDDLMQDPRSLALFLARQNPKRHTLLVLDQFEELFTLCRDEFEREAFIDNLLTTMPPSPDGRGAGGEGGITLILTLRADFYAHLAQYPELRDAVAKQQEYIGPMTTDELRRAIEEPAKRGHWEFEPGLVDLILRDVGDEPGALPLLSHALLETWKRRAGHTLTLKGYADAGGVRGAIAHTAESVYQNLSLDEKAIARDIFLRLTELGEGTEDMRRRASFEELMSHVENTDDVRAVLNTLAEARLITLSEDTAEVAHEALIREWPTLREWLNQDRAGLQLHRHITETAHEWELLERDAGALYRGAHLAQAREWAALHATALNTGEKAFLDASNALEQSEVAEREAQIQRELEAVQTLAETQSRAASRLRSRNRVITGALALAILLAGIALFFNNQSTANAKTAQEQQQIALARELAASSINNLSVDPERSILLALQAVGINKQNGQPVLVEAEDALHRAVESSRVLATLREHSASLWSVAVSRDGKRLATIGLDGTAKVWDLSTNQVLLTLPTKFTYNVTGTGAVFNTDGTQLLTISSDNIATLWNLATGKALFTLSGHTALVSSVAISPDGKLFATAGDDNTVKLWDAATGKEVQTLTHTGTVLVLAFSPDGKRIYAGSDEDGYAIAWDVASGKELFKFDGQGTGVTAIVASPDGTKIATGEIDATVRVWDSSTGNLMFTLFGHASQIVSVAFSPDSKTLASAAEDGSVKLWDAATGKLLLTLQGHTSGVLSVTFSPDGNRLYTASRDSTVKIWDVSPAAGSDWLNLIGHTNRVFWVTYSPDGTRLATRSWDNTVKVWDVSTSLNTGVSTSLNASQPSGKNLFTIEVDGNPVNGNFISYSPDGKRMAVVSGKSSKIVDAESGAEILTLAPFDADVTDILYSPDGTRLAAMSVDSKVKIYDSTNGTILAEYSISSFGVWQIAFSPDGKRLASANDDGVNIWDASTGKELLTFSGHEGIKSSGVAFSLDGKWVASSGNDGNIRVWDSETGKEIFNLTGHTGPTFAVAFSPDGQYLASSSVDRTIKVWKLPSDGGQVELPLTLYGHTGAVYRIAFSPDGLYLATAGRNPIVRIYALDINELIAIAKSRLTRELTTEECQKYLHMDVCPAEP